MDATTRKSHMRGNLFCATCGTRMDQTATSAPQGRARCRECRRATHGREGYSRGCRCEVCRAGKAAYMRAWHDAYKFTNGIAQSTMWRRAARDETGAWPQKRGRDFTDPETRQAIYERDGWTCQLCGDPVDPEATERRLRPSLDHIVPQSHQLVPDHSPSNLRLAHVGCNAKRRDRMDQDAA